MPVRRTSTSSPSPSLTLMPGQASVPTPDTATSCSSTSTVSRGPTATLAPRGPAHTKCSLVSPLTMPHTLSFGCELRTLSRRLNGSLSRTLAGWLTSAVRNESGCGAWIGGSAMTVVMSLSAAPSGAERKGLSSLELLGSRRPSSGAGRHTTLSPGTTLPPRVKRAHSANAVSCVQAAVSWH